MSGTDYLDAFGDTICEGDIVRLTVGGPTMAVGQLSLETDDNGTYAKCYYANGEDVIEVNLPTEVVYVVTSKEDMERP